MIKNEKAIRTGWGRAIASNYTHWFVGDGPKGRPIASLCKLRFFQRWCVEGFATLAPANACPVCQELL